MILARRKPLRSCKEGNRRFVSDISNRDAITSTCAPSRAGYERQERLLPPFSVAPIPGCLVEIIFDQGLGDLFVIRVAGNIVAPSLIGSVEFAAEQFGTRLVVVLGHTMCGAIDTTLQRLWQRPIENQSRNLHSIVDLIRPSVEGLLATHSQRRSAGLGPCRGSRQYPGLGAESAARLGYRIRHSSFKGAGLLAMRSAPSIPWRPGSSISSTVLPASNS